MTDIFIHPQALVETEKIGPGTRVWAFSHILEGAQIGAECNICETVFIENDVCVGDRVTIKNGVQLWDGVTVEDDVFIGPNATFTNALTPRSKQYPESFTRTLVRAGASVGANATILPGLTIGQNAMIGAGAVVSHDVPPHATVVGNPAHIIGYVEAGDRKAVKKEGEPGDRITSLEPAGVKIHEMPLIEDLRGKLTFAEIDNPLPFIPQRYFLVHDVPGRNVRGEHAHRECHQFLVCVKGSCSVMVDDGTHRAEVTLNRPTMGLFVPARIWASQYRFSPDAVLLVLASELYSEEDYIRDYDIFLWEMGER